MVSSGQIFVHKHHSVGYDGKNNICKDKTFE
nr:MAG TPA: hypothetical protein [Caudoviricetes sp.]